MYEFILNFLMDHVLIRVSSYVILIFLLLFIANSISKSIENDRIKLTFKEIGIGLSWDKKDNQLYIILFPFLGVIIKFK